MSDEQEEYLAVLKASYGYTPQSEDEIEIKEDQFLLLLEKTDDDWWKVKPKGDAGSQSGLVPAAYVESSNKVVNVVPHTIHCAQASCLRPSYSIRDMRCQHRYLPITVHAAHSSVVKAQYDYDAVAQGEISLKEDQTLLVFGEEEDGWLLVQAQASGKVGYIPGNYVETFDDASTAAAAAPSAASNIVIPDSPPRPIPPVSTYTDPAELVRSTASKVKADAIKTWAISEIDKKGKKKKGTLGVGNGAIFFASEADKAGFLLTSRLLLRAHTPVRKWQIIDITSAEIDKPKHVLIEVGGATAASLHFHAGSKDTAEEILAKLESSRSLASESTKPPAPSEAERRPEPEPAPAPEPEPAPPAPTQRALPPPLRSDGAHSPSKKGVHFSEASPAIIPPRSPSPPEQVQRDEIEGLEAVALYDFRAQGEDELTVAEGDALWIIEQDGDEWWKCRNVEGNEGVVPASYVEPTGAGRLPPRIVEPEEEEDDGVAEREAEERAAAERAEQEAKEARERERKEKQEQEQRAKAVAMAAEVDGKRKEREKQEREERERKERARREKEREEEAEEARKRSTREAPKAPRSSKSGSDGRKTVEKRPPPDPNQTREWRDRSGQFRVEAAFLGYKNGVLRLHKVNGVVIEVPSEKMSVEDMRYVERVIGRAGGGSPSRKADDDDEPLAKRRQSLQPAAAPQKKAPPIDWFEFFLNAGCDVDDCTRYASAFERDKIDEAILPDISEGTLRTLGLREGDIIRVNKAIQARRPKSPPKPASSDVNLLSSDEAPSPARSPGPPNLFTGPGGQLKNARRGRPTPSKSGSTTPGAVDLGAISTASEQIARSTTPLMSSPTVTPSTVGTTTTSPVQVPPRSNSALASGFDDDAWTNRPSSTKPVTSTPPIPDRVPSVPPLPGALPVTSPAPTPSQPPRAPSAPVTQPATSTGSNASSGLGKTTESDIFNQLARLSQLRVQNSAPSAAPKPSPGPTPSPSITSPPPVPVGYNQGLGVGSSPSPLGQHLQAQQTGFLPPPAQGGARGPFAPVPANQGLLAPLVPTTTGFNGFVPTRPATSPAFLGPQPTGFQPQLSLAPQPTGFQPSLVAPQPTGFQPSLVVPQPTGFQPSLVAPQPTGFQPSLAPQLTGFQPSLAPQLTGFGGGSPFGGGNVPPVPPLPHHSRTVARLASCSRSPPGSTPALVDRHRSGTASHRRFHNFNRKRYRWVEPRRRRTRTRQMCLRL
ncbi:hypothetical protein BC827DRAFT_1386878 [Russula dissimulans]|nr:hypothetical protein BC827DRAFT_1386878 [Russula dissimulans]